MRYSGAKYHLTVRGNARQRVFFGAADYERFLEQLDSALEADGVVLYAYVLMPNHYHLLAETPRGNVSRFMQRLNTAYGMYFRVKRGRPGHCFQGRYGARLVGGDEYLLRLTRYIHLNPIKVQAMAVSDAQQRLAALNEYRWSSYRSYAGLSAVEARVNYRWLELMERRTRRGQQAAYRRYVESMTGAKAVDEPLQEARARHGYAVGNETFLETVGEDLYAARMSRVETGDIRWPQPKPVSMETISATIADAYGVRPDILIRHGRAAGPAKAVAVEMCCRLSGVSQRAVARHFGYRSESSIGKLRESLRGQCANDPKLARRVAGLERECTKL